MNRLRIPAFTIMEVTITMLISAILIGITYTSYSIISKSYQSYNAKNEDMAVILRLNELLQKDFDRADVVLRDANGISLKSKGRIVSYQFGADNVVRVGVSADTFKVKSDSLKISFENETVNDFGSSDEKNRLDQLDLTLVLPNESIPYHYHKIYSSANLFNRNPDAIN